MARAAHLDDRAGIGIDDVGDVGSIDPRMSAADAILSARLEDNGAWHRCIIPHGARHHHTMRIAIGADHAGYQLKDSLRKLLEELGIAYQDFGASTGQSVDYPDYARAVAEAVASGAFERGILVCGTGVGMAIAANKVPGVRSAPIVDADTAKLAREHNDLNVLALGARVLPESRAREIVKTFLQTPFAGGRHATRVSKIHSIEPSSTSSRS